MPTLLRRLAVPLARARKANIRKACASAERKRLTQSTNRSYVSIDWEHVPREEHPGKTGSAFWRTYQDEDVHLRIVEYPAGYVSDHWCAKGHIIHMLQGEIEIALKDGSTSHAKTGATLKIAEGLEHCTRNASMVSAQMLIVDF